MSNKPRMARVLGLAESEKKGAVTRLRDAREHMVSHESQLAALRGYREDYARSFRSVAAVTPAYELRAVQDFLNHLDVAIASLETQIADARTTWRDALSGWQETEKRMQNISAIVERQLSQSRRDQARREQQELEELALPRIER
ncbi:MAG: flagellar export protein FliJ [Pseudomonadota bacterium]